jgi:hypothetical protein
MTRDLFGLRLRPGCSIALSPLKHEALTQEIIGAAMAVMNELRPGLDEKLYENALVMSSRPAASKSRSKGNFLCTIAATSSENWCPI